jgi:antitoxin Phd
MEMDVKLNSLIPFEKIKSDVDAVFQMVEKNGNVVLLKDNQPAYIITKYATTIPLYEKASNGDDVHYTLQDAMKIVLSEATDKTMHAAALAEEIYNRKLYFKKDGGKAQYNQVRARCGHYPNLFEALPGNYIKLKDIM